MTTTEASTAACPDRVKGLVSLLQSLTGEGADANNRNSTSAPSQFSVVFRRPRFWPVYVYRTLVAYDFTRINYYPHMHVWMQPGVALVGKLQVGKCIGLSKMKEHAFTLKHSWRGAAGAASSCSLWVVEQPKPICVRRRHVQHLEKLYKCLRITLAFADENFLRMSELCLISAWCGSVRYTDWRLLLVTIM